jgi:hypothetical protein
MTHRPDSTDRAEARDRAAARWRWNQWRPLLRRDAVALYGALREQLNTITEELHDMTVREDAADARTAELIELVRQHEAALKAENDALKAALASADADKAAALDAESEADAGRQEAFNAALDELAGSAPAEPPAEG